MEKRSGLNKKHSSYFFLSSDIMTKIYLVLLDILGMENIEFSEWVTARNFEEVDWEQHLFPASLFSGGN
jgi:hypothetical protein